MNITENNNSVTLEDAVSGLVAEYLNLYENSSILRLSNETGINRRTILKIKDASASLESIDKLKLIKLIQVTKRMPSPSDALKFIGRHVFSNDNSYEALFSVFDEKSFRVASNLEEMIQSEDEFAVYILAANKEGTSTFQIKSTLGAIGEEALTSLVDKGLLIRNNHKVDLNLESDNDFTMVSRELIKKYFSLFSRMYKSSHAGKERNYIAYAAQSVTLNSLSKIQKVLKIAHSDINTILTDRENIGDYPFYMGMIMDTFTLEEKTGGNKNEMH